MKLMILKDKFKKYIKIGSIFLNQRSNFSELPTNRHKYSENDIENLIDNEIDLYISSRCPLCTCKHPKPLHRLTENTCNGCYGCEVEILQIKNKNLIEVIKMIQQIGEIKPIVYTIKYDRNAGVWVSKMDPCGIMSQGISPEEAMEAILSAQKMHKCDKKCWENYKKS